MYGDAGGVSRGGGGGVESVYAGPGLVGHDVDHHLINIAIHHARDHCGAGDLRHRPPVGVSSVQAPQGLAAGDVPVPARREASGTCSVFNMFGMWILRAAGRAVFGREGSTSRSTSMCGLCGGLLYLYRELCWGTWAWDRCPGSWTSTWYTPLIGASAGVFGMIVACAFIAPNTIVQLLFPPIPLKMKTVRVRVRGARALILLVAGGANAGGDAAHLGGAIAGYLLHPQLPTCSTSSSMCSGRSRDGRPQGQAGQRPNA